jgi:hypothetical protein
MKIEQKYLDEVSKINKRINELRHCDLDDHKILNEIRGCNMKKNEMMDTLLDEGHDFIHLMETFYDYRHYEHPQVVGDIK